MTDQKKIIAAAQGDSQAMLQLFTQYQGLLQKAAHQPHLRTIAEDALSQARLSFYKAILTYDESRQIPFAGYAKAMVYGDLRTLFKHERRYWQRELLPTDTGDESTAAESADPRDPTEAFLTTSTLTTAISQLPQRQQQLLCLLYQEDKTQKEAAAWLGITQQAAAALKVRALKRLHHLLA